MVQSDAVMPPSTRKTVLAAVASGQSARIAAHRS
jgi:hypothetical protein